MNKKLFLIFISIPGLLSLLPKLHTTYNTIIAQQPERIIDYNKFLIFTLLQSFIFVFISIWLGHWATQKINWQDYTLNAITTKNKLMLQYALHSQILPSLLYSIPASFFFVATLYIILFPLLDHNLVIQMNDFSKHSIIMRIFYGGIVEEILLRWNILSLLVLCGMKCLNHHTNLVWWSAIVLSALAFGCGHLPIYFATTLNPTITTVLIIIFANSIAGIFFGWIFKNFGLISAMIAHMLFHITWFLIYGIINTF